MFTPASLIAAATCASAPGVFSMSMTRSTAICPVPGQPTWTRTCGEPGRGNAPARVAASQGTALVTRAAVRDLLSPAATIRRPMNFELTPEQQDVRRLVREFAEQEVRPVAEELDRTKSFPYEIVEKLGGLGLMGIPYPEEYGGGGADDLSYAIAIEELTRVDSSVAITVAAHTSLGTWPIYAFGSAEQKQEWLPRLCSGGRLAAFGLTEPEAGPDGGKTPPPPPPPHGPLVINGAKQFITNAGTDISGCVTITARTGDDEISNILVPNGTPGYEVGEPYRKMGWNASDTRPLAFEDCRVPEENLVGPRGQGFKQFLQTLDGGRIGVSAMGVGLAQGALDEALAYAKERIAFAQPISKYQAIQTKLADLSTEIEAARLLTYKSVV